MMYKLIGEQGRDIHLGVHDYQVFVVDCQDTDGGGLDSMLHPAVPGPLHITMNGGPFDLLDLRHTRGNLYTATGLIRKEAVVRPMLTFEADERERVDLDGRLYRTFHTCVAPSDFKSLASAPGTVVGVNNKFYVLHASLIVPYRATSETNMHILIVEGPC